MVKDGFPFPADREKARLGRAMSRQVGDIGILFADVAGSTRLYETFGDLRALQAIGLCLQCMTDVISRHEGRIVKTIGDEIMAAFGSPVAMFTAAVEIQKSIDRLEPLAGQQGPVRMAVRIGFHFGPSISEDGDYFGDTVNVAARMAGIAKGDQIIATDELMRRLLPGQRKLTRTLDRLSVKGKADTIGVMEVLWQDNAETTHFRPADQPPAACRTLALRLHETEWRFDRTRHSIALGREPGNDVVIQDFGVSRRHATIERRRDKWVMIDHSSNGTYVTFADEPEIKLHREEIVLHRPGVASLGRPAANATSACFQFSLA